MGRVLASRVVSQRRLRSHPNDTRRSHVQRSLSSSGYVLMKSLRSSPAPRILCRLAVLMLVSFTCLVYSYRRNVTKIDLVEDGKPLSTSVDRLVAEQIQWLKNASRSEILASLKPCRSCILFVIRDNAIVSEDDGDKIWPTRKVQFVKLFQDVLMMHRINDTSILVNTGDTPDKGLTFGFCKQARDNKTLLIPNHRFALNDVNVCATRNLTSWTNSVSYLLRRASEHPYDTRDNRMFMDGIPHVTKKRYFDLACQHPDIATGYIPRSSVHFPRLMAKDPERLACYERVGLIGNFSTAFEVHNLQHKFLVYSDGNTLSDRMRLLLASGSVILRIASPYVEFYTSLLKPYVHYVPVREDLSDLFAQRAWALQHPDACRAMVARNRLWVETFLTYPNILEYTARLINGYTNIMRERELFNETVA